MTDRVNEIEQRLLRELSPESLDIVDDSHKHAGHTGAAAGGGHYTVTIVADCFRDKNTMTRHRMIYSALGDMMPQQIHALSIKAYAPEEI